MDFKECPITTNLSWYSIASGAAPRACRKAPVWLFSSSFIWNFNCLWIVFSKGKNKWKSPEYFRQILHQSVPLLNATMSRRKVRGLTKTGRQVSEDPDLDNLLSNLSPEEMEELQKEVSVVPDPDPSEIIVVDQTDLKPTASVKNESQLSSETDDFKSRFQRNLSTEVKYSLPNKFIYKSVKAWV